MDRGSKSITKAINKLGKKQRIIFINSKFNFSMFFSIISNKKNNGKKNIIGSQTSIPKVRKIINDSVLKILLLGINK
tara:strand:+ start:78 stop:308 length:231 start_codon:yes stop_codon:yes gene_type:complete